MKGSIALREPARLEQNVLLLIEVTGSDRVLLDALAYDSSKNRESQMECVTTLSRGGTEGNHEVTSMNVGTSAQSEKVNNTQESSLFIAKK